jgi:hypothetical protein
MSGEAIKPATWSLIHFTPFEQTDRLRVAGGWLIRTTWFDHATKTASATAMCFQPERAE